MSTQEQFNQVGNRLNAVEAEICQVQATLSGMQAQLDKMQFMFRQMDARHQNARISTWNERALNPFQARPLRKYVGLLLFVL
jgi:septal ring factor EnvC (AmiA/AmiB activator)